ncbi:MAG TPA: nucleoside hydrolase [Candidatus Acidoferrales bacterium]|nr:nucleoside hydrolase [Candidatus Acidoferrales bacterium]
MKVHLTARISTVLLCSIALAISAEILQPGKRLLAFSHSNPPLKKVIIDQDCAGPGGTDLQAVLALINSPETDVLGITVVTGDQWLDEEVQHTLRLLEIIGRTDIPVLPGAENPMVNSKEKTAKWEKKYGNVVYQGAWNFGNPVHGPNVIPPMPEGVPKIAASKEDAAHFLVRMVRKYPHEVTIYEGGPLTNLALALKLDPQFASLSKGLVLMGGSIHPVTNDPEFTATPHREFNLWMDPEAAHQVLHAAWPRIVVTTVDTSVKTHFDRALVAQIGKSGTPAAQYVAKYANANLSHYLWDELAAAAWLDPSIITSWKKMYLDVSIDHGATYGNTLTYPENDPPTDHGPLADVQEDLDTVKFYKEFVELMSRPTPNAHANPDETVPSSPGTLTATPH